MVGIMATRNRTTRELQSYLCERGRGKPSKVQVKRGAGVPLAIHLRATAGPGCRVWAMNRYARRGGDATTGRREVLQLQLYQWLKVQRTFLVRWALLHEQQKLLNQRSEVVFIVSKSNITCLLICFNSSLHFASIMMQF